jgi:hypothetical protein
MTEFNYDNRTFAGVENYDSGDANADTRFHYRQQGEVVWATYHGSGVLFGTLVAKLLIDGSLDMVWQYLNRKGLFISGTCRSTPTILPDGRYRLRESWTIDSGESGTSVIEEILDS